MALKDPGNCDEDTKKRNRTTALGRTPVGDYGPARVLVIARDTAAKTITFRAKGTDNVDHDYTARWADESVMWVSCPSSLPSRCKDPDDPNNPSNLPLLQASGALYVAKNWANQQPNVLAQGAPKWPGNLPLGDPAYAEMTIFPSTLVITGTELEDGQNVSGTVDLSDPAMADVHQTIVFDPDGTKLRLSKEAFKKFLQPFPAATADFKADVATAVATIQASPTDAKQMARAWGLIADAIARIREDPTLSPALGAMVQQVLPKAVL